jgi:hypothetical protein
MPQPTSYKKSPSTLYQVYWQAPQLVVKARGPKSSESFRSPSQQRATLLSFPKRTVLHVMVLFKLRLDPFSV